MKLSIIIPAHNEEKRIKYTLIEYAKFYQKKYKKDFEIIVVLNGCTDNTLEIVKKVSKKHNQIKYLNFKQAGKGFAIIEGFKIAKGDLIGFVDADCSTSPEAFYDLVKNLNNFDGIVADRWRKESVVKPKQSLNRRIASRVFNFLVRFLFNITCRDTQCGAKLFKKRVIKRMLPKLGVTEWVFDIDLLYHIKQNNFKIKEIPTVWRDIGGSKINIIKDSIKMFLALLRLRMIHSWLKIFIRFYDLMPEEIKLKTIFNKI